MASNWDIGCYELTKLSRIMWEKEMGKILVTGGAGFIGSHTIVDLIEKGYAVISVDNYSNSDSSAYEGIQKITGVSIRHYDIDLCDNTLTNQIFIENPDIDSVIHFAALKAVGDSVSDPVLYFHNNLNSLLNILDCCRKYSVNKIIFSSSCTVYGNPLQLPVTESTPEQEAESPYGRTKQFGEKMIQDCIRGTKIKAISLRYFNPAGAHSSAKMGESPLNKPQNLVPVITSVAKGTMEKLVVFGNDYDTRDGSCLRDYIHVMDLANAHTLAVSRLEQDITQENFEVFNLGTGEGVTVLEAIEAFESTTGQKLNYELGDRRPGDVIAVYSDLSKAQNVLNWKPQYTINDIMKTAWEWEKVR